MNDIERLLRQAIEERRRVRALYKGRHRELCPHALGWKGEARYALLYQCAGGSAGGLSEKPEANWRCMDVAQLEDVEIIQGDWLTPTNYSLPTRCLDVVEVSVDEL